MQIETIYIPSMLEGVWTHIEDIIRSRFALSYMVRLHCISFKSSSQLRMTLLTIVSTLSGLPSLPGNKKFQQWFACQGCAHHDSYSHNTPPSLFLPLISLFLYTIGLLKHQFSENNARHKWVPEIYYHPRTSNNFYSISCLEEVNILL